VDDYGIPLVAWRPGVVRCNERKSFVRGVGLLGFYSVKFLDAVKTLIALRGGGPAISRRRYRTVIHTIQSNQLETPVLGASRSGVSKEVVVAEARVTAHVHEAYLHFVLRQVRCNPLTHPMGLR